MKHFDRVLQRLRVDKVLPYVSPGARVLDIGCADGELLRQNPQLGRYVGIDPDLPARMPGVENNTCFLRSTFPSTALDENERFDVVAALAVLEHVPPDAQPTFASACARHLRGGGHLVLTVPSPLVDPILHVLMRLRVLDGMETSQHYGFNPRTTPDVFRSAGLSLERHERFEIGLNHLFVFRKPKLEHRPPSPELT